MKNKIIFAAIIFRAGALVTMTTMNASGAFEFKPAGARGSGLSGACAARSFDATAPYWNPSGLGLVRRTEIASFYAQFFSLAGLSYTGTALAAPSKIGGIGLAYSRFGPAAYREQEILLSHGVQVARNFYAGYTLKGMFLNIEEYGAASAFGADGGVLFTPREDLMLALSGKNLNHPTIGASKESLPTSLVLASALQAVKGLWLSCDLEKLGSQTSIKTGLELEVAGAFAVRGGMLGGASRFSGGFGARAGTLSLDYAYLAGGSLPGSHQFTLRLGLGKPNGPAPLGDKPEQNARLNLNTATVKDLTEVKGIGTVTAEKIIAYREIFGFNSMDDLLNVPGMNRRIFERLKERGEVRTGPAAPAP